MTTRYLALGCAALGTLFFAIGGLWAMAAPRSFFEQVATYPPYNIHLLHDIGAFQLGIAAALVAGLLGRSGLAVGLWGGAVGASAHAISHWIDAHLGRPTDPPLITIVAIVLVVGLAAAEATRAERSTVAAKDAGKGERDHD